MSYSQKSKFDKTVFTTSKIYEAKQWIQEGYEPLISEEASYYERSPKKEKFPFSKQAKQHEKESPQKTSRWRAGKQKGESNFEGFSTEEKNVKRNDRKINRRSKVLDGYQQYKIKNIHYEHTTRKNKEENRTMSNETHDCGVKEILKSSEDDKSLTSNASTTMSDTIKKQDEENLGTKDNIKSKSQRKKRKRQEKRRHAKEEEAEKSLDLIIHTEQGVINIKLSEDEEDFEGLLRMICRSNQISGKAELYFQINLLKAIQEVQKVPQKNLETYLNHLLDINFQLLLDENNLSSNYETIYYLEESNPQWYPEDNYYGNAQPTWCYTFPESHQIQGM